MRDKEHKPDPKDPAAAVRDYIHEVATCIRQLGMGDIMSDERQSRQVINKMVNGLSPMELKERMKRERESHVEERK